MQHHTETWPSFDADLLDEAIRSLSWTGIGRWDNLELLAQIDPTVSTTAFAEAAAGLVAEESSS